MTSAANPCLTSTGERNSAIAWPQQVAACLWSTHLGALVKMMEGSALLSVASNHHTAQLAVPSAFPGNVRSFRGGTSHTSAKPRSNERSSAGSVRMRKSPSPLSRSTPIHSPSSKRPLGQNGQNASRLTSAKLGSRSSQSTASSRSLAGMTGAPSRQSRSRAPRDKRMRFSPRPDASMSSLTSTSNLRCSGGLETPRTSVHQTSNGA
mmetsp:Transcript_14257/g.33505  ORF Transcript_14257/g.33505 Transcript_14257/m.33505 type:complete len:207 (-) Transcript_14257:137-757(-)